MNAYIQRDARCIHAHGDAFAEVRVSCSILPAGKATGASGAGKLSRKTLSGWFKPICELLEPLYRELKKKMLSSDYIQVDETTLPVINHDKHKAVREYIWIVRAAVQRLLFFHYDNGSHSQKVSVELLKTFKGQLQRDGHSAYDAFENWDDVYLCGYLAHIRRHMESCMEENQEYATQGLKFIQDMYNVDYMADEQQLSYEERAALRQHLAEPLLDAFEFWLQDIYHKVLKRSLMGKAIAYAYPLIPRMSCMMGAFLLTKTE